MNNDFRKHLSAPSLKRKFFIKNLMSILAPCLIPLLILGSLAIYISDRYIRLDEERSQESLLGQYNELIQVVAAEVDSLSLSFDKDPKIASRLGDLLSRTSYSYEDLEALFYLKNMIDVPANSKPYIHSVYIYSENAQGRFLSSREGLADLETFHDTSWYAAYLKLSDVNSIATEVREIQDYSFQQQPTRIVTLYKPLTGRSKGLSWSTCSRTISGSHTNPSASDRTGPSILRTRRTALL
ncbi:hypothetical protein LJK88_10500 [Paenibacillus sp. P26]|nr:hypothetical protein LJK88_10500 [Paenibacillus sp. P26]